MVGGHHQLNGQKFEHAPGDTGQGILVCYSLWGHKEPDMTEQLNSTYFFLIAGFSSCITLNIVRVFLIHRY